MSWFTQDAQAHRDLGAAHVARHRPPFDPVENALQQGLQHARQAARTQARAILVGGAAALGRFVSLKMPKRQSTLPFTPPPAKRVRLSSWPGRHPGAPRPQSVVIRYARPYGLYQPRSYHPRRRQSRSYRRRPGAFSGSTYRRRPRWPKRR